MEELILSGAGYERLEDFSECDNDACGMNSPGRRYEMLTDSSK
jgi:hypothetical protein